MAKAPRSRPTLVALVGAGASIQAGAPATADLLEDVLAALPAEIVRFDLDGKCSSEPFHLATAIRDRVGGSYGCDFQFEKVIAVIEEMLGYDRRYGPIVSSLLRPEDGLASLFYKPALIGAHKNAINAIVQRFLALRQSEAQLQAEKTLISFFKSLGERFRVVLVTLNYDTILDRALPWYDGFEQTKADDYREFDSASWIATTARRKRHLIMHLHGSLRFGLRPPTRLGPNVPFGEPVLYGDAHTAFATTANQGVSNPSADGIGLPATPIIAGGHKGSKLLHNMRPYAFYNSLAFTEMTRADKLLIMGYGFGDSHVQGWIDEHLRVHPYGRLVLVTYRTGSTVGGEGRFEKFLRRLDPRDEADKIYVDCGGTPPLAEHGPVGGLYLVASGAPLTVEAAEGVLKYLEM